LSQEKFWEQWNAASGEKKPGEGQPGGSGSPADGIDADALAAWLKADPDALVPPVPPPSPTPSASPAELAELWPPAAPVDPFAGIQGSPNTTLPEDWDLAFDEPAPSTPAAAPGAGISDFALGGLAGPTPAGDPFAPGAPGASPVPAAPPPAPFGPPPPPAPPPAEALQAPPLRLAITIGRRTTEQNVQGEALIGRPDATRRIHPEIDLRQDDAVSRRHAKIFVRNGRYVLTDLNSTNGTRYNEEWMQPEVEVPLKPGDLIEIGEQTRIKVLEAPETNA
jgi:hypothetical protein